MHFVSHCCPYTLRQNYYAIYCFHVRPQAGKTNGIESALAELDMDHYDSTDEERDDDDEMDGEASAAVVARALGGRSSGIVLDDPYLAAGADSDDENGLGDMDSEDRDDYVLRADDLLILAARTEDDVSTLEVWVYEEASRSTGACRQQQQQAQLQVAQQLQLSDHGVLLFCSASDDPAGC